MESLATYLSDLSPEQLARVIANRPETQLPPEPRTLAALVERLTAPNLLGSALLGLARPEVQVTEALAALGDGCDREELAAALGVADDDPVFALVLQRLAEHAIAWPEGEKLRTVELDRIWRHPLGLGAPLVTLLGEERLDDLRRIARQLGLAPGGQKQTTVRVLADWLASGENVRRLAATAPKATRQLLEKLTWHGPYLEQPGYLYSAAVPAEAKWAVERGLICGSGRWGERLQMPCEVALALRGPDYRLPFDPLPPPCPTVPVAVEAVDREAAAAASTAVVRVATLLEAASRAPIALLKTGGVGVRELRRLGKLIGADPEQVRFWLELAIDAELLGFAETGLLPTDGYDEWHLRQPAEQLIELIEAWLDCEGAPFYQPPDTPTLPALVRLAEGPALPALRSVLLTAIARVPAGSAVVRVDDLVAVMGWLSPLAVESINEPGELIIGFWREATLLGLVAHDSASSLARAAGAPTPQEATAPDGAGSKSAADPLAEAARQLLPAAQETVLLQADLTAVAVGPPSGRLAALLDGAADRESGGGAWTWRFSAASVRRALDAGHDGDELLAALRAVVSGGRLPQPLEYLVADVSRRHGAVRVRPVACCLRCDDPTLLNEIRNVRSLAKLGLTELAPTVLASAAPVAETLAALRAAGYAPVGENADGTVALERTPRQRAVQPVAGPLDDDGFDEIPAELIDKLITMSGGRLPEQLLGVVALPGAGDPPAMSDPEELARNLLRRR